LTKSASCRTWSRHTQHGSWLLATPSLLSRQPLQQQPRQRTQSSAFPLLPLLRLPLAGRTAIKQECQQQQHQQQRRLLQLLLLSRHLSLQMQRLKQQQRQRPQHSLPPLLLSGTLAPQSQQ
jgi:hypothetical protein